MKNISIGQFIILLVIGFLIFGDINYLKKKVKYYVTELTNYVKNKKNRT